MSPYRISSIGLFAIMMSLLMMLALVISYYPLPSLDVRLMREVQESSNTHILQVMDVVSALGNVVPALVLSSLAILVLAVSPFRFAILPLTLTIPADALSYALKILIDRPRPSSTLVTVHHFLSDPAFPSSHVVHYTVFFGFLAFLFLKTTILPKALRVPFASVAIALVALVPFSRMYLGVHWPTDVLAGYLLGGSVLLVQIRMFQKLAAKSGGR